MAKSSKKKKKYSTKGIGKYRVVMTDRVRLLLIACFVFGFLVIGVIALISAQP
jgi:phage shock protein PspC (stress-responsive transcriptional regulator)